MYSASNELLVLDRLFAIEKRLKAMMMRSNTLPSVVLRHSPGKISGQRGRLELEENHGGSLKAVINI